MIEFKGLSVKDKERVILHDASVKLPNGRIYGVLAMEAEDGARLLAAMSGAVPYEGQIKINGFDLRKQSKKARQCLGYLPSGAPLYLPFDAVETLSFVAQSKGIPYERAIRQMHELLESAGLSDVKHRLASSMEEIDRRLLAILQAAMGESDILLLSDPTADLNDRESEEVLALIETLGEKRTVFVSARTVFSLPQTCDAFLILQDGTLTEAQKGELADEFRVPRDKSRTKERKRKPERDGEYELISDGEEDA